MHAKAYRTHALAIGSLGSRRRTSRPWWLFSARLAISQGVVCIAEQRRRLHEGSSATWQRSPKLQIGFLSLAKRERVGKPAKAIARPTRHSRRRPSHWAMLRACANIAIG